MKIVLSIIGVILFLRGFNIASDGLKLRRTEEAKIERTASKLTSIFTSSDEEIQGPVNQEASRKIFGGCVLVVIGMGFFYVGTKSKQTQNGFKN